MPFVAPVATFTAAAVALFKEDIVKIWRRPALRIRMLLKPPDCVLTPTTIRRDLANGTTLEIWKGKCYYFRLWIENRGSYLAERVQVYVKSVSHQMGDGRCEIVSEFIPMNLRWADSPEPGRTLIFETLNPNMGKHCDFGTVLPPNTRLEKIREGMKEGESTLNLQTEVFPSNEGHRLRPGKYKIELLVAASNAKPKAFTVNLDWNGHYEETTERMFVDSLKVEITP